jgi:hypothetical protein
VAKTTSVQNIAGTFAMQGKTVLLVDADPQCNLTASLLNAESVVEQSYACVFGNGSVDAGLQPGTLKITGSHKRIKCCTGLTLLKLTRKVGAIVKPSTRSRNGKVAGFF